MTTANAGEGMEKELSYIASWNVKWYSHSGKEFDSFFKKKTTKYSYLTMWQSHSQAIYPRETKTYVYSKAFIQMFIALLFVIAQNWQSAKRPLFG